MTERRFWDERKSDHVLPEKGVGREGISRGQEVLHNRESFIGVLYEELLIQLDIFFRILEIGLGQSPVFGKEVGIQIDVAHPVLCHLEPVRGDETDAGEITVEVKSKFCDAALRSLINPLCLRN